MSAEIDELTGNEGGRLQVVSQSSTYIFDLDTMTTTRIPGPNAELTINDTARPIREIDPDRYGSVWRSSGAFVFLFSTLLLRIAG